MAPIYRVEPWQDGWAVFADRERSELEPFPTPMAAVMGAKELARRAGDGARICVYDAQGLLLSEFSYRPPGDASAEDEDAASPSRGRRRRRPRKGP
jgi:hypothetical protein